MSPPGTKPRRSAVQQVVGYGKCCGPSAELPSLTQLGHEWSFFAAMHVGFLPSATIMAALVNPTNPSNAEILSRDLQATARLLGLQLHLLHASSDADIDAVFATLTELRAGGLVIGTDALFTSRDEKLAALALRYRIPTIYQWREFVAAGGLMSYGGSFADSYRLAGVYTGRILKGEKPADLPVQRAVKLELIINLKTAKALGLEVPLMRVDEVIE